MSHSRETDNDIKPELARSHAELSKMILQGRSFSGLERHCSFLNTGGTTTEAERFANVSFVSGLDFPDDGRALSVVDWDQDGDLDVWLSARNAPRVRLMLNDSRSENHFLMLNLKGNGTTSNRDAIGARVQLVLAKDTEHSLQQIQTLRAGEGFLSQDSKTIHFGLGKKSEIKQVLVQWPDGTKEIFTNIKIDQKYELTQGSSNAVVVAPRNDAMLDLIASEQRVPKGVEQARIPLVTRMPLGSLPIRNYVGKPQILEGGTGGPVLITLWASWCPTCKEELTSFTQEMEKIQANNIGIIALSIDGLGDERSDFNAGKELLDTLQFQFPVGFATHQLVDKLQNIHDLLIPLQHPLPVPSSFLMDGDGQLSVIYKGKVDIDTLIKDSLLVTQKKYLDLIDTSSFQGSLMESNEFENVVLQNQARIYFKRGTDLIDKKQYAEALTYFNKVLEIDPKSFKTHYNMGLAFARLNDIDVAIKHIQKALELNPQYLYSHKILGQLLLKKGGYAQAKVHFTTFLEDNPDDIEALNTYGILFSKEKNYKAAEDAFKKASRIDPLFTQAYFNLAQMYLVQNNFKEANNTFAEILTIEPNYPEVLYNLGFLAELSGETQRAINLYSGELKNNPVSYKTLTALGRIMEKKGAVDYAVEYYSQAIALNNQYEPAIKGLNRIRK